MSVDQVQQARKMVKRIGPWAGVRWMRNRGVAFEDAYFVMFDRRPRK